MAEQSIFDSLSRSLSEVERKELLLKIQDGLQLSGTNLHEADGEDHSYKLDSSAVRGEILKLPWYARLVIWFKQKFSGRPLLKVFLDYKMKQLKQQIRRKMSGVTGFETRDISPVLAEKVFGIYQLVVPLRQLFLKVWTSKDYFEHFSAGMISSQPEGKVKNLDELFPVDEMVQYLLDGMGKDGLKKILFERVEHYTEKIPSSVFLKAEEVVLPFYCLKELVLFPFQNFFDFFHLQAIDHQANPRFKRASANLVIGSMENLYKALLLASKVGTFGELNAGAFHWLVREVRKKDDAFRFPQDFDFGKAVSDLLLAVREILKTVPFSELVRYFHQAPYYSFQQTVPQIDLLLFYTSYLKIHAAGELDQSYSSILTRFLDERIRKIFGGTPKYVLAHVRGTTWSGTEDEKRMFRHERSLNLLYGYLKQYFESFHYEIIGFVENDLLSNERELKDRLSLHSNTLEDLVPRMERLDKQVSSDTEEGRYFHQLRESLAADPSQQRMFRLELGKLEKDIYSMLDEGQAALTGLRDIYMSLDKLTTPAIQRSLNNHYIVKGKATLLRQLVRQRTDHAKEFSQILQYVKKMETT